MTNMAGRAGARYEVQKVQESRRQSAPMGQQSQTLTALSWMPRRLRLCSGTCFGWRVPQKLSSHLAHAQPLVHRQARESLSTPRNEVSFAVGGQNEFSLWFHMFGKVPDVLSKPAFGL